MAYRERLTVPVYWWLLAGSGVVALFLAYDVAVGPPWSILAAGLAALASAVWLAVHGSLQASVDDSGLHAGAARLPGWAVGEVEALDRAATTSARGRDADPSAFFAVRGYVRTSVRVQVDDPADPVPYWLVSTRRPEQLAAALSELRDSAATRR